ncbi:MAG TPA: hypothetical protein VK486_07170 [Thermoleophilaceae bacterium]|nr:hypothetical protein [Thermoleophilaceae bacterium]
MPPAPRSAEREEERRLNTRTLTIASVASASAAAVTSQLWIAGTWVAAAITPVLVTLLSEALHRPTARIARAWTSDQPALSRRAARPEEAVAPPHGDPLQPRGGASSPLAEPASGPVRVYRQPTTSAPRRRIAIGAVAATAAIAFVVAVVTLTAGDLVSGGSIGKGGGRTTLWGGAGNRKQPQQDPTPKQDSAPDKTGTTTDQAPTTDTAPDQAPPPSDTAPIPPPTDPTPTAPDPNAVP